MMPIVLIHIMGIRVKAAIANLEIIMGRLNGLHLVTLALARHLPVATAEAALRELDTVRADLDKIDRASEQLGEMRRVVAQASITLLAAGSR